MADPVGVCVAFDAPTLGTATPTWTNLEDYPALVQGWSVERGRQDELAITGTGTARIAVNDDDGILDPTNTGGPFFGDLDPMKRVAITLHNPVTDTDTVVFTGFVEDFQSQVHESQVVTHTEIACADLFDLLAAIEVAPGASYGQTPPYGSEGDVFFEDASPFGPRIRMEGLLTQAGIPAAFWEINSGNVTIQETLYSPGTSVLTILQDAAAAEFPGVANLWIRKDGVLRFTGRQPRFRPDVAEYDISVWKAGDGAAILLDSTLAQIRGLTFSRPKGAIINAALAMPQEFDEAVTAEKIQGQIVTDAPSIALYGTRTWQADNLLTDGGLIDPPANDKWEETKLFATYYVANYADPTTRVTQITFRSLHPTDTRAQRTWALMCGVELNDIIRLTVDHPGGGGFDEEDFFVEGISYEVEPLQPAYDNVTLTLDVTPRANYTTNPFDADPDPE